MSKVQYVWEDEGFTEILNSDEVLSFVENVASSRLPEGNYIVDSRPGETRGHIRITINDYKTYRDNMKNNTLAHALGIKGK